MGGGIGIRLINFFILVCRLTTLETILRIDHLSKKYPNLKGRSGSLRNELSSESSSPSSSSEDNKACVDLAEEVRERCVFNEGTSPVVDEGQCGSIDLEELKGLVFHGGLGCL